MAGIYIHVPFCKKACHYCDFHFSVNRQTKQTYIHSLLREISLQKDYLGGDAVDTVYFGGGTPSLLTDSELRSILDTLFKTFRISPHAEITLEANPDDLTGEKARQLRSSAVNRLSIGIQSFMDRDLAWMNRAHTAQEAEGSVKRSQDAGFENISVDLMYGLPALSHNEWEQNIYKTLQLQVPHLSCYALTVEPRTALAHFISTGKSKPASENSSATQFEILMEIMQQHGWLHYEISNFAVREDRISRHNSSYWKGIKYLGLGPSAHSFNGTSRQWNVSNNRRYIAAIAENKIPFETETLTEVQRINERIMTELRTMWGLKTTAFAPPFPDLLRKKSGPFLEAGLLAEKEETLFLTDAGKLLADKITAELMADET